MTKFLITREDKETRIELTNFGPEMYGMLIFGFRAAFKKLKEETPPEVESCHDFCDGILKLVDDFDEKITKLHKEAEEKGECPCGCGSSVPKAILERIAGSAKIPEREYLKIDIVKNLPEGSRYALIHFLRTNEDIFIKDLNESSSYIIGKLGLYKAISGTVTDGDNRFDKVWDEVEEVIKTLMSQHKEDILALWNKYSE